MCICRRPAPLIGSRSDEVLSRVRPRASIRTQMTASTEAGGASFGTND